MIAFSLLLFGAALGLGLARATRLPAIPLLILMGILAGMILPGDREFLEDVLVLGVAVLVFTAGIELNPARVGSQKRLAATVGVAQFALLGLLGSAAGSLLGLELQSALYLGLALSASSTLVVVRMLQQRQQLFEPLGRLILGVLLVQDLLIILLIPVVSGLSTGMEAVAMGVAGTLGLLAAAWVILRWVGPRVIGTLASDGETLLLATLSVLFLFLGAASFMGLPLLTGAFLAGVALSGFPVHLLVRGPLTSLTDFFHVLFFTALGAYVALPSLPDLGLALLLTAGVLFLTPPLVAFIAERAGLSARPALSAGLLLAQTSEFSLVIALLGVTTGQFPPAMMGVVTMVTILTMIATPFLASDRVAWSLMAFHPSRKAPSSAEPPRDHVLILGCGRSGTALLESLLITSNRIVVVDDDPVLVTGLGRLGIRAVRGDISDEGVLRNAGVEHARIVVSTVRRIADVEPALQMAPGTVPILVRTFGTEESEWVEARGGKPILYAQAASDEFFSWADAGGTPDLDQDT